MTSIASSQSSSIFFILFIVAASLLQPSLIHVDTEIQLIIASIAISLAGLPHGAADAWIAKNSGLANDYRKLTIFFLSYVLTSVLVILFWYIFPVISLAIFLIISSWHFGDDNRLGLDITTRFCSGFIITSSPSLLHGNDVLYLFDILSGNGSNVVLNLQVIMFFISLGYLAYDYIFTRNSSKTITNITNLLLLIALSFTLPPLIYFTIYFCCVHSWQHMRRILSISNSTDNTNILINSALLTLSVVLVGITIYFWLVSMGVHINIVNTQILFIGLAALSLPHIILVDYYKANGINKNI